MAPTRTPAAPPGLRPCGCGGAARYLTPAGASDPDGYHYVCCVAACGADPAYARSRAGAVRSWNRRHARPNGPNRRPKKTSSSGAAGGLP
jgi:hypothetical protein